MNNDLISRSALKKTFTEECCGCCDNCSHCMTEYKCELIDNAPTVEYPFYQEAYQTGYEEGKNERPQGEWIHYLGCGIGKAVCSECGQVGEIKKYCGNCGAYMRGEVGNNGKAD